jgi:hypothetical protein
MVATWFERRHFAGFHGRAVGLLFGLGAAAAIAVAAGAFGPKPDRPVRPAIPMATVSVPAAIAVAAGDASDWTRLGESQRAILRPLQGVWPGLDSANRQRWLEVAQKVGKLSLDARERVQARMADWAKLPPNKRAQARLQYVYAKRVPVAKRAELWSKYQASPAASAALGKRDSSVTMVAPALAQVRPGATTVPVTKLLLPATIEVEEDVHEPG